MSFIVTGLDPAPFQPLFAKSDAALAQMGAQRVRVDAKPSAPCRITLADAEIGEHVILVSYEHQPAATPYRQQGPIFVRDASARFEVANNIPPAFGVRALSLRAFNAAGMMLDADLVDGAAAAPLIARLFGNNDVAYIHAHYAKRGCFAARIDRSGVE